MKAAKYKYGVAVVAFSLCPRQGFWVLGFRVYGLKFRVLNISLQLLAGMIHG